MDRLKNICQQIGWTLVCLLFLLTACMDDRVQGGISHEEVMQGEMVDFTFQLIVPGLEKATRSGGETLDEEITSIDLYLFGQNNGFKYVQTVDVSSTSSETSDDGSAEYNNGEYLLSGKIGTFTTKIPGDTKFIHFIANYEPREGEEFSQVENEGYNETAVIAPLLTNQRCYWGRCAFENLSTSTVVLYRNYAKLQYNIATDAGIEVLGWTLYREPKTATVAPFNRDNIDHTGTGATTPFSFDNDLSKLVQTLPSLSADRVLTDVMVTETAENQLAGKGVNTVNNEPVCVPTWLFEYDYEQFGQEYLYAIFKIKKNDAVKYYKIGILYDLTREEGDNIIVYDRKPYAIKRNHEYTINFKGITEEFGYTDFAGAASGKVANNSLVSVMESLPEIVSTNHTLRIEETADGSSTIRYYKDSIGAKTYTISDILVYYDGDDCTTNATDETKGVNSLEVTWEDEIPGFEPWEKDAAGNVVRQFDVQAAVDAEGNTILHTYRIRFKVQGFVEGENGAMHYKSGLIRVFEKHERLLSRFVKVYMGPAITFRPLLISNDIPNLIDERLSILFTIPDEKYLPKDLYPIEILFGSDRVDVEKNLEVDAMKVVFDTTTYANVLWYEKSDESKQWYGTSDETDWGWTTDANNKVPNDWKYKYVYTIESSSDAGEKRITLRTVIKSSADFKVMMEGRSTVTGTSVFNTRQLDFMMQDDGGERRIMMDEGMPDTRLVTAYINQRSAGSGSSLIKIPYTLGAFADGQMDTTKYRPAADINLWVHFDPAVLTPHPTKNRGVSKSGGQVIVNVDPEGNHYFVKKHQDEWKTVKDTIFFTATSAYKSPVFITARNNANYGGARPSDYTAQTSGLGAGDYLFLGANSGAGRSYRSASAVVSLLSAWDFNPAPSLTGKSGSYSHSSTVTVDKGIGEDLYVRIDRPLGESTPITINTAGKWELQNGTTVDGVSIETFNSYTKSTEGATYTITMNPNSTSEYCYLHFKALTFDSRGTITFTGTDYSANNNTLQVSNATMTFQKFQMATEELLYKATDVASVNYIDANIDDNTKLSNDTIKNVAGAYHSIRVFFPTSVSGYTGTFKFKVMTQNFEFFAPENDSHFTTNYKYTSGAYDVEFDNVRNYTFTVKSVTTVKTDEKVTACYIDLYLKSKVANSAETIRFMGLNSGDEFYFYPYNVNIRCKGYGAMQLWHSKTNGDWESLDNPLYQVEQGGNVYYRVAVPYLGPVPSGRTFDLTFATTRLKPVSVTNGTNVSAVIKDSENSDGEVSFTITPSSTTGANADPTDNLPQTVDYVVLQMQATAAIMETGTTEEVVITPADATGFAADTSVIKGELPKAVVEKLEISVDNSKYTTLQNGGTYLNIPSEKDGPVYFQLTVPELAEQEVTYTITSLLSTISEAFCTTDSEGDDITNTFRVRHNENGVGLITSKTVNNGTAEIIQLTGVNDAGTMGIPTQTLLVGSVPESVYETYETGELDRSGSDNNWSKDKNDNCVGEEIFDINGSYFQRTIGDYDMAVKMGSSDKISFYAPFDNMYVTIGSALRTGDSYTNAATIAVYHHTLNNPSGVKSEKSETMNESLDSITERTYKLEQGKGLYSIMKNSGSQFALYYIKLTRNNPLAATGTFSVEEYYTNNKADGAIWSDCKIDAEGNMYIHRSTELYLKLKLQDGDTNATTLKLDESKGYTFTDGTYEKTGVEPDDEGYVSVYLKMKEEGVVNSTVKISGYNDACNYQELSIPVKMKPQIEPKYITGQNFNSLSTTTTYNVGDKIYIGIKVPQCFADDEISFVLELRNNTLSTGSYYNEYLSGLTAVSSGVTVEDYNNEDNKKLVTIPGVQNPSSDQIYYLTYDATCITPDNHNLQIKVLGQQHSSTTDETTFYDVSVIEYNGNNYSDSFSNKITIGGTMNLDFRNTSSDVQGYMQYYTEGTGWISFMGDETGYPAIQAHVGSHYVSCPVALPAGIGYKVRITIPKLDVVTADGIDLYNGDTKLGPTSKEIVTDGGMQYIVFHGLTAPATAQTMTLTFRSNSTATAAGYSLTPSATGKVDVYTSKTWDFAEIASGMTASSIYLPILDSGSNVGVKSFQGLAAQGYDKWNYHNNSLYNYNSGERSFGVLNLPKGAAIEVSCEDGGLHSWNSSNATLSSSDNVHTFTMTADGILGIKINRNKHIYYIKVTLP